MFILCFFGLHRWDHYWIWDQKKRGKRKREKICYKVCRWCYLAELSTNADV